MLLPNDQDDPTRVDSRRWDYILVGGGLANGLMALALLERRPDLRLLLLEREPEVGGNHTWCFHPDGLTEEARALLEPLTVHRWSQYEVRFPDHRRTLESRYACMTSERLREVLADAFERAPRAQLWTGCPVAAVRAQSVALEDGRAFEAEVVIDGRGPSVREETRCGYQKFVGLEVELAEPHGLRGPLLMDATVPQQDGFRFLYVLPFGPRRVLLEDTYFAHAPDLCVTAVERRLEQLASARGYRITRVLRRESGVLPMPFDGLPAAPTAPLASGYAGGWFHPATGYSVPVAARLALTVAELEPDQLYGVTLTRLAQRHIGQVRYAHWLNWMLFSFFEPESMWNVFSRFYRLPEGLIERFYDLSLSGADRARILIGRPPKGMSVRAAAHALRSQPA